jgi:hypothetical protein
MEFQLTGKRLGRQYDHTTDCLTVVLHDANRSAVFAANQVRATTPRWRLPVAVLEMCRVQTIGGASPSAL